jgi:hypothetical protein
MTVMQEPEKKRLQCFHLTRVMTFDYVQEDKKDKNKFSLNAMSSFPYIVLIQLWVGP